MAHMGLHREVGAQASQVFGLTKTAEKPKTTLDVETPDTRLSSPLEKKSRPRMFPAPLYITTSMHVVVMGRMFIIRGWGFHCQGRAFFGPKQ